MRGRKPKPTELKKLAGNPGKRAFNDQEPKPARAKPQCPSHLSKEGKAEWRRILKELYAVGLVTKVDRAALAAYCQVYGRWVFAEGMLEKHGHVIKKIDEDGNEVLFRRSPYLSIADKALAQMKEFLIEFGMTPSSRTRIKVDIPSDEPDELEQLLFRVPVEVSK